MSYHLQIPDSLPPEQGMKRTTHLAIGAHADDLEIMAYHGIAACYERQDLWFGGVVVSDGAGSQSKGIYSHFKPAELVTLRHAEQLKAAKIGHYSFIAQMGFSTPQIKQANPTIAQQLREILIKSQPEFLYLHNPTDRHDTHIAVLKRCLEALRSLTPEQQPKKIYGCEVWRDLDWLGEESRIALDCSANPELARQLIEVFDSQISGGKHYDLAAIGRRHAHATFSNPRQTDQMQAVTWAMDLTPLLDPSLSLETLVQSHLDSFRHDVLERLKLFHPSTTTNSA